MHKRRFYIYKQIVKNLTNASIVTPSLSLGAHKVNVIPIEGQRRSTKRIFMCKSVLFTIACLFPPITNATNSFSCPIKDLSTRPTSPKLIIVHMNCTSRDPIETGTNACTGQMYHQHPLLLIQALNMEK